MKSLAFDLLENEKTYAVNIVTSFSSIAFEEEYMAKGVKIITIPFRQQRREYKEKLRILLSSAKRGDIVYLNVSSYCNWTLFELVKKLNCKVIIHGHNSYTKNWAKKIIHLIGRIKYRKIGKKIAVSKECNNFMFGGKGDFVIPNGIVSARFKFNLNDRIKVRSELCVGKYDLVIGCVGRILKEKNQISLISHAKKYSDIVFVFVGAFTNYNYEKKIKKIAPQNCIFVGQTDNVGYYLSGFDALCVPSKREAYPLAVIEGITNGLNVVCNKKLYKKLPVDIKENENISVYDEDVLKSSLASWNGFRNDGEIPFDESFDIKVFLAKTRRIINE